MIILWPQNIDYPTTQPIKHISPQITTGHNLYVRYSRSLHLFKKYLVFWLQWKGMLHVAYTVWYFFLYLIYRGCFFSLYTISILLTFLWFHSQFSLRALIHDHGFNYHHLDSCIIWVSGFCHPKAQAGNLRNFRITNNYSSPSPSPPNQIISLACSFMT